MVGPFHLTEAIFHMNTVARRIVQEVFSELSGRSGVGDAIDECDAGIKLEIAEALEARVQKVLDSQEELTDGPPPILGLS